MAKAYTESCLMGVAIQCAAIVDNKQTTSIMLACIYMSQAAIRTGSFFYEDEILMSPRDRSKDFNMPIDGNEGTVYCEVGANK
jgi:hypothetical protein